ncbi:8577_t:CDS:1, partial [Scutellospora calospora]
ALSRSTSYSNTLSLLYSATTVLSSKSLLISPESASSLLAALLNSLSSKSFKYTE